MPRRNYPKIPLVRIKQLLNKAHIDDSPPIRGGDSKHSNVGIVDIKTLVRENIGLGEPTRKSNNMLFFVMYDIEDDKVRTQIAKYLHRQGCLRIQKSIFIADLSFETMDKIMMDLTEVQGCYENKDSIIIVPISSDYLKAMKVIGKGIDLSVIMKTESTLFF